MISYLHTAVGFSLVPLVVQYLNLAELLAGLETLGVL